MAFITSDFVKETSAVTGTGAIGLGGARSPAQTFSSVLANGDTCHYAISHDTLNQWEVGLGTYNSGGNSITRTQVLASSNANALVNFSAGSKRVDLVLPAARIRQFVGPIQVGATTLGNGTLSFSNANGVSFGLATNSAGGTITASADAGGGGLTNINISAGTTSSNLSAIRFGNANNVSFGLDAGSLVTASADFPRLTAIYNNQSFTNATESAITGQTLFLPRFLNSSLMSSVNVIFAASSNNQLVGAAFIFAQASSCQDFSLHGSNGVTFGALSSTLAGVGRRIFITASVPQQIGIVSHVGGNVASSVTAIAFENASNVTWALSTVASAVTVRASVAAGGGGGIANLPVSAGTTNALATQLSFADANGISFGLNGSTVTASIVAGGVVGSISAGTTSVALGQAVFANANGVSFGLNGSTVTASVAAGGGAAGSISAGTTSVALGQAVFSNSNNVSFGLNVSTVTASVTVASTQASIRISAGTTSVLSSAFTFSNSNGMSFGMNNGTITGSYTVPTVPVHTLAVSAAGNSISNGTLSFANANGVSFGMAGSTVTASVTPPGAAPLTVSAQNGSFSAAALSFGFGVFGRVLFSTTGGSLVVGEARMLVGGGTQTNMTQDLVFVNSNNVSFGLNGSVLTASASFAGGGAAGSISAGTTSASLGQVVFSNSNNVSFGLNGSTVTASATAAATRELALASHNGGLSNSNVSAMVFSNAFNVNFDASTAAGGISFRASALGANISHVGGNSVSNLSLLAFSNASNVTWSLSTAAGAATVIASVAAGGGGGGFTASLFVPFDGIKVVSTASVGASYVSGTVGIAPVLLPQAVAFDRVTRIVSFTASTAQTVTHTISQFFALYTRNGSTLSLAHSQSGTLSFNQSGTANSSLIFGGRQISMPWTTTIPGGEYWLAYQLRLSGGNTGSHTLSHGLISQSLNTTFAPMGAATANSFQEVLGLGAYSATTALPPVSIAFSQITGAYSGGSSQFARRPWMGMVNGTA